MKVLDTNIVIEYLKGVPEVVRMVEDLRATNQMLAISVITEIEVLAHPARSENDVRQFNEWLDSVKIVPVDSTLGRLAAELRRTHKLKIADSIVAATAHMYGAQLVTRDRG